MNTLCQAEGPLLPGGVQILVESGLSDEDRDTMWQLRSKAHVYLADRGAKGQLAYLKFDGSKSLALQVSPYQLPSYLDWPVLRSVASIWQQFAAVLRSVFGSSIKPASVILDDLPLPTRTDVTSGKGALIDQGVIQRQLVWQAEQINVLYNYRPISTESQVHFLLTVKPEDPARDFSELSKAQYTEVLALAGRIDRIAREHFQGQQVETHVFDKAGRFAGQTEDVYHAHVVVILNASDGTWSKLRLLWRMLWSPSPLAPEALKLRVEQMREIFVREDV